MGEGRIEKTVPVYFSTDDPFDVRDDWGTPIASASTTPFKCTAYTKT